MSYTFGKRSRDALASCDRRLQDILNEAIKTHDFAVLCGFRDEFEQNKAVAEKRSTKVWPNSKHNSYPSRAVDIAPFPIDWSDTARFARLVGYIERIAFEQGKRIRWGGDWNGNGRTKDERFVDMPHLELVD